MIICIMWTQKEWTYPIPQYKLNYWAITQGANLLFVESTLDIFSFGIFALGLALTSKKVFSKEDETHLRSCA